MLSIKFTVGIIQIFTYSTVSTYSSCLKLSCVIKIKVLDSQNLAKPL